MQGTDFGRVQIIPIETFYDPTRGMDPEARQEWKSQDLLYSTLEDVLEIGPPPSKCSDWPRVREAIRRCGLFVIETATPDFRAMLRFSPEHQEQGDYEIRHHRGSIEKGRVTSVVRVSSNEKDRRYSMLCQFAFPYVVWTIAAERPLARKAWLVGLNHFRAIDETGLDT